MGHKKGHLVERFAQDLKGVDNREGVTEVLKQMRAANTAEWMVHRELKIGEDESVRPVYQELPGYKFVTEGGANRFMTASEENGSSSNRGKYDSTGGNSQNRLPHVVFAAHLGDLFRNTDQTAKPDTRLAHLRWDTEPGTTTINGEEFKRALGRAESPAERAKVARDTIAAPPQTLLDYANLGGSWEDYGERVPDPEKPVAAMTRRFHGSPNAQRPDFNAQSSWARKDRFDEHDRILPTLRFTEPLAFVVHPCVGVKTSSGERVGEISKEMLVGRTTLFVAAREIARDIAIEETESANGFSPLTDLASEQMSDFVREGMQGGWGVGEILAPAASSLIVGQSVRRVE